MANVSKATLVLDGSTTRLKRALASAQASMRGVASKMKRRAKRLGRGIATAMGIAGAAMAGLAAKATQMAAGFEREMTKVSTLVGLSSERVRGMRDDVLALAAETGRAPEKLAKALFRLTSGGERGAEVLRSLRKAAQAARIGMGEVNELTRVATSSVQAFASQGETLNSALNTIFFTIREGNVRVDRLQSALGQVQGTAAEAGLSFDDLGAFLATVSRTMGDTQKGARGLRQFLARLQDPTRDMIEGFDAAGLSVDNFADRIEQGEFVPALIDMVEAARENDVAIGRLTGSVRALTPILSAAGAQSDEFLRILKDSSQAQEEFEGAVDQTATTLADKWSRMTATAEAAMVKFGERSSGVVGDLVDTIRRNIPQIATIFARTLGTIAGKIADFLEAVQGMGRDLAVGGAITALIFGPGPAVAVVAGIIAWIDDIRIAWKRLKDALGFDVEFSPMEELRRQLQETRSLATQVAGGLVTPEQALERAGIAPSGVAGFNVTRGQERRERAMEALRQRANSLQSAIDENVASMARFGDEAKSSTQKAISWLRRLEEDLGSFTMGPIEFGGGDVGGPSVPQLNIATPQISGGRTPFNRMRQQMQGRQMVPTVGRGGIIDEEEIEAMRKELGLGADQFNRAAQTTVAAFGSMAQAAIRGSDQMATSFINGITQIVQSIPGVGGLASSVVGAVGGIVGAFVSSGGKDRGRPTPVEVANRDPIEVEDQSDRGPEEVVLQFIDSADPAQMEHDLRRRTRRDATERIPQGTSLGGS